MIGFYNYTVWLTYASLLSAVAGVFICFSGLGHPYLGMFCLLFSGFCDAFDGKVARSKKNRTEREKKFGMQIDSLADLVAFGVLPACIGSALYKTARYYPNDSTASGLIEKIPYWLFAAIFCLYVLAALIRLAYFNVTEDERVEAGQERGRYFTGLPVTSAALIFPTFLLIQHLTPMNISVGYYALMLLTAFAFVARFKVRKPSVRGVMVMVVIGAIECVLVIVLRLVLKLGV